MTHHICSVGTAPDIDLLVARRDKVQVPNLTKDFPKLVFTIQLIHLVVKMQTLAKPFRKIPMTNGYNGTSDARSSLGNRIYTLRRQWRKTLSQDRPSCVRSSWLSSAAD